MLCHRRNRASSTPGGLFRHKRPTGRPHVARLRFEPLEPRLVLDAGPLEISEFMAINDGVLRDGDGDYPDWVEIHNPTGGPIDLAGWHLTDNRNNLTKWEFPARTLEADAYLVVFASGQDADDYVDPEGNLHTNFKLDGDGEYLALVRPDDATVAHEYTPAFPKQYPDFSYGVSQGLEDFSVPEGGELAYVVPTGPEEDAAWTGPSYDDSAWSRFAERSTVLVTEVSTLVPDWVEIQNVSDQPVDVSGWSVAVNDASRNEINAVHDVRWQLSGTMAPGGLDYQHDDKYSTQDAEHYWGTDVVWRSSGRGWVAVLDGALEVVDFVVWGYDASQLATMSVDVEGTIITAEGIWNGAPVPRNPASDYTLKRGGASDHDRASDFEFTEAGSQGEANQGLETPFATKLGTGIGFDVDATGLETAVQIDVEQLMHGVGGSLRARLPFQVDDPSALDSMRLRISYNDGFAAYINGQEVAARNAPDPLRWDSSATAARSVEESLPYEEIDLTDYLGILQAGTNVLAIQGLNCLDTAPHAGNFLVLPELSGAGEWYFDGPTPRWANGVGFRPKGPHIGDVTENPPPPADGDDLTVTAEITEAFNPIDQVLLRYRVMFGGEVTVAMRDDGQGNDAAAGDGIYTATIPAAAAIPGQMVRWKVTATDTVGNGSVAPMFLNPTDSPEYFGTLVEDTSIVSQLPVLHWFVQNPQDADTDAGTRASLFYQGEFYDNVRVDLHGQSSRGFPKKSYDFDLNRRYRFQYAQGQQRVKDFDLLTNWADKSKVRNTLAYEVYRNAGSPHHVAFPVRVQQNGQFFSTADWVEDADDRFLERLGLDPNGALYKMYNILDSVSDGEKKTRKHEGKADLQALIDGARLWGDARTRYFYDHLNVPEVVNFLAATIIMGTTDMGHKNYYVYHDTNGTGEWQIFPWDVDLSFGRNWTNSLQYYDDAVYTRNGLFIGSHNLLMGGLYNTPSIREMYLRRVRTLMDEQLQPPGTPPEELKFERRLDELLALIDPHDDPNPQQGTDDADLDYQKWSSWGNRYTMRQDVHRIRTEYFPARRDFLYNAQTASGGGPLPGAQVDLAALPPGQRNVDFGPILVSPASGNQDEEYIQIVNNNDFAVDVSGWELGEAVEFTFQPGTVIPAGGVLYVSPNVNAFRTRSSGPSGGQGLFVQGGYRGHLSSFGETIRLRDARGAEITSLAYPGDPSSPQQFLRVTEVMYHPPEPTPEEAAAGFADHDDFEFIELTNTGTEGLNLEGVRFTGAVTFTFGDLVLDPDALVVVVASQEAFEWRYGTAATVAGQFASGGLDDQGGQVKLEDANNGTILDFTYDRGGSWPGRANGNGSSLQLRDLQHTERDGYDDGQAWRSSSEYGGSPGEVGRPPRRDVLLNEVFSRSDPPRLDAIELYNTTDAPIELGGWYLSDDSDDYLKFRIPDGTTIPGEGYLVFDERDFNPNGPWNPNAGPRGDHEFALSAVRGDDVWLMEAVEGRLVSFVDHVEFPAAAAGESFGRWLNGQGDLYPMTFPTLDRNHPQDGPNSGPRVGPLVISELHYNSGELPGLDDLEFVEIYNPTGMSMDLTHWELGGGIDYPFDHGTVIAPYGTLTVLSFDPHNPGNAARTEGFRTHYGLDASVALAGGYGGRLENAGERVRLYRADEPRPENEDFFPLLWEDEVDYEAASPWPTSPEGEYHSLHRLGPDRWGNDPASWIAAEPTPGQVPPPEPAVVGRHLFYNHCAFDDARAGLSDDDAVAPAPDAASDPRLGKTALLPGQTATFSNYSSYRLGINGIMVDIAGPIATPTPAAFEFKVGNHDLPGGWEDAPEPIDLTVRAGAGTGYSNRVTITWQDRAIRNTWLQVIVKAEEIGLAADDVFYFGSAPGEAGDFAGNALVNTTDEVLARGNPHGPRNLAAVDDAYDFDRNRLVNTLDRLITRAERTGPANCLRLITVPAAGGTPGSTSLTTLDKLAWLDWFEPPVAERRSPKKTGAFAAAVDQWLATCWQSPDVRFP